jgi:hypothetical protein
VKWGEEKSGIYPLWTVGYKGKKYTAIIGMAQGEKTLKN